jgi:hypothetical protein
MYNRIDELKELYSQHSQYSANPTVPNERPYDSLLQWPSNGYFEQLKPDAALLKEALTLYTDPQTSTVADQVFGTQKRQEYIGIKHLANLFYERSKLHKQHVQDIDHRNSQIQEKLFCVKINNLPERARRLSNLEGQLLQLENQKREEELAFWKDTVELRQQLFEGAAAYKAAKHRYSVFSQVEGKYGR